MLLPEEEEELIDRLAEQVAVGSIRRIAKNKTVVCRLLTLFNGFSENLNKVLLRNSSTVGAHH